MCHMCTVIDAACMDNDSAVEQDHNELNTRYLPADQKCKVVTGRMYCISRPAIVAGSIPKFEMCNV